VLSSNSSDVVSDAARHARTCDECRKRIRELRAIVGELRSLDSTSPGANCLNDDVIALLATDPKVQIEPEAREHVIACESCRGRLTAVAALLSEPSVMKEIAALEGLSISPAKRRLSRFHISIAGGLLAAAVATIVFLGPISSRFPAGNARYREPAITSTNAPQLAASLNLDRTLDSLRWTGVPQADLYRVRLWNGEGTVVWSIETRDTLAAVPPSALAGTEYMWDVSARTGWDRWVSSEFAELTVAAGNSR
jgi:hypothetical protein